MNNLTPLEKTIWNLAMTGGIVMLSDIGRFNLDSEYTNPPESYDPLKITNICLESGVMQICADHKNGWSVGFIDLEEVTPILHSLNKITEPVLEGGKVPIVELAKMVMWEKGIYGDYFYKLENDCVILNGYEIIFYFQNNNFYYTYKKQFRNIDNQKLFDQLRQWGFNIENLPEGTYVEKSTLKL